MDWASLAGQITGLGAPILGSILGGAIAGPAGAALGSQAGKLLAQALGAAPTPEAVQQAIQTDPAAVEKVKAVEAAHADDLAALQAELADVQSARTTMTTLAASGSRIAWGPSVISTIVVVGNILIGLAAMFHPVGADPGVVLFLLGGWNTAFAAVISFWMGSSNGSQKKDAQIGQFLNTAAAPVGRAVERAVTKR
jgi:outer membrane lipoprotein SlyB